MAAAIAPAVYAGTPVSTADLPAAARTFLSKHFPGDNVRKAEKDQGHRGMEYGVDLESGAEIDFRDNGDWKEVKLTNGTELMLTEDAKPMQPRPNRGRR